MALQILENYRFRLGAMCHVRATPPGRAESFQFDMAVACQLSSCRHPLRSGTDRWQHWKSPHFQFLNNNQFPPAEAETQSWLQEADSTTLKRPSLRKDFTLCLCSYKRETFDDSRQLLVTHDDFKWLATRDHSWWLSTILNNSQQLLTTLDDSQPLLMTFDNSWWLSTALLMNVLKFCFNK